MAGLANPRTTFSDTTPHKRAIADLIDIIDPSDVPCLKYFGISEEGRGGNKVTQLRILNWPSTKVEWLEDTLAARSTSLAASVAATASTATLAITVSDANVLREGHIILVDSEYMLVRSVSSNSATVTRMWGGSSGSHAANATVEIVSNARDEGDESDADFTTDISAPYNYTQIFQAEIKISRSQLRQTQYGIEDEWDYQVAKKFKEQMILLEKTLFHGVRNAGGSATGGGTTNPRSMGGFPVFITDNTQSLSNAALTQKTLEDKIQDCWTDGGKPDLIICGGWVKRKINSFYYGNVRTERTEDTGGVLIDYIATDFGELKVMMSRWIPSTELLILQSDYIGILPFDEFGVEDLAKTGDYYRGQLVGEYTLVVKNDKAHARITGISTTS